ncbi:nuclear transport factor 2 family protein [Aquimarina macrocephali]|uniref:nuclear transport factor 2 family protein n=1 Tax=Aquimarina macrocephali TaxID=666563 RepID=UPI000463774E|nr:nuclear transport factor 2 family protein [Aquimarina macrocephali]
MKEINQIWETYTSCWSEDNSVERIKNLRKIMTDNFEYLDPNVELKGYEQLSEYMSQFQKEFVGASFTITDIKIHHGRSLTHWNMVNSENEVVGNGSDFATYENGKLKQITSFFKEN